MSYIDDIDYVTLKTKPTYVKLNPFHMVWHLWTIHTPIVHQTIKHNKCQHNMAGQIGHNENTPGSNTSTQVTSRSPTHSW